MRFCEIADALDQIKPTEFVFGTEFYHVAVNKSDMARIIRALRIAASNSTVSDDEDADDQDGV